MEPIVARKAKGSQGRKRPGARRVQSRTKGQKEQVKAKLGPDPLGDMWLIAKRLADLGFSREQAIRLLRDIRAGRTTYRRILEQKKGK